MQRELFNGSYVNAVTLTVYQASQAYRKGGGNNPKANGKRQKACVPSSAYFFNKSQRACMNMDAGAMRGDLISILLGTERSTP